MVSTDRIRNVVLVGHNGNGKTSLVEAMLYRAGVLNRPGRIEQGNTVMDHDPEERERQQSLSCKVTSFEWKGHKVNIFLFGLIGIGVFIAGALACGIGALLVSLPMYWLGMTNIYLRIKGESVPTPS